VCSLYTKIQGFRLKDLFVETYYCLRQAVGDDLIFEVEVIDPKDEQGDV